MKRKKLNTSKIDLTKERGAITECIEYIDDKERHSTFKAWCSQATVTLGVPRDEERESTTNGKTWMVHTYVVTIEKNGERIAFEFHNSRNAYEKRERPNLYDILACVGSDYYYADNFKEFCDEFGYNEDSRKDHKLFLACQSQAAKLRKVMIEEDARSMPG